MSNSGFIIQKNKDIRYDFIDILKSFAIFFVVVGHLYISEKLNNWIYSFHMPLFFMISGFLLKQKHLEIAPLMFVKELFLKYIIPYSIFFLGAYLFLGMGLNRIVFYYFSGFAVLWFLAALFLCRIYIHILLKFFNKWILLFFSLLLSSFVVCYPNYFNATMVIRVSFVAFFFYLFGFCVKDYLKPTEYNKKILALVTIFTLIISIIISQTLVSGTMNNLEFSGATFLYIPFSFFGIISFASLSMILKINKLFLYLSSSTLVIYGTHSFFLRIVRMVLESLHKTIFKSELASWGILYAVIAVICAFILAMPAKYILNKIFPRVFKG